MRPKEIWTGDGGNNPSWGYRVPHVYKIRIESSASLHSSELTVECGRYGPGLIVWQNIRVYDRDSGKALFHGRIDDIRPIASATHGQMWRIHARDFMSTLTDNQVAHKLYFGGGGPAPDWFVPNWRLTCGEGQEAGQGNCGKSRLSVVTNLVQAVRHGFTGVTSGMGVMGSGDIIAPNYLESSGMSIYDAVRELAESHPHDAARPSEGVGYDFRQYFSRQPPVFQYFKKGSINWDAIKEFRWQPPTGASFYIPVISYDAEREGLSVYSRSIAAGHGDLYPGERVYISGVGWREWGGTVPPGYADIVAAGMTDVWNPPEWGGKSYQIQREVYTHDESAQDKVALAEICLSKLRTASDAESLKGVVAASFSVAGIPFNNRGEPPLPGDAVKANTTDLPLQRYIVDKWVYEEPPGVSTYTVGRRPVSDMVYQTLAERRARHRTAAAAKRGWTSQWRATQPGVYRYWIDHGLGVVPRNISVTFAKYTGADNYGSVLSASQIKSKTVAVVPQMYYEPAAGQWVGYQIIETTKDRIDLFLASWVGYSRLAASGDMKSDGWCRVGDKTAIGISLVA